MLKGEFDLSASLQTDKSAISEWKRTVWAFPTCSVLYQQKDCFGGEGLDPLVDKVNFSESWGLAEDIDEWFQILVFDCAILDIDHV